LHKNIQGILNCRSDARIYSEFTKMVHEVDLKDQSVETTGILLHLLLILGVSGKLSIISYIVNILHPYHTLTLT